ncbi:hypothetical protein [Gordonia aurantiaca]|uniref:hypothetical protein n=1 Tax=Gordonia sp. B21 TaxID=3151852 RepID=UPI0032632879
MRAFFCGTVWYHVAGSVLNREMQMNVVRNSRVRVIATIMALGCALAVAVSATGAADAAVKTVNVNHSKSTRWTESKIRLSLTGSFSMNVTYDSSDKSQLSMAGFFKGGVVTKSAWTNHRLCVYGQVNLWAKRKGPGTFALDIDPQYVTGSSTPYMSSMGSPKVWSTGSGSRATQYGIFSYGTGWKCVENENVVTYSIPVGNIGWMTTAGAQIYKIEIISYAQNYEYNSDTVAKRAEAKKGRNV